MKQQAIDLYRVQRQLEREIRYWEKLTGPRVHKPTLLDALRVLQDRKVSLFWYVFEAAHMKLGVQRPSKIMELVEKLPIKTWMTKVHASAFTRDDELTEANPEVF